MLVSITAHDACPDIYDYFDATITVDEVITLIVRQRCDEEETMHER